MNILVPMAGEGTRTKDLYTGPKPILPVGNRPMFYHAVSSAEHLRANLIFVVRSDHNIADEVQALFPSSSIVLQDGRVNGAVLSCLLAKDLITEAPLLIMDCDMAVKFDYWTLFKFVSDAGVVTFPSNNPAYSYVVSDMTAQVLDIAEKKTISDNAVAGSFFWRRGTDFVRLAERVVQREHTSEVYLSSVIKEAVLDGLTVKRYDAEVAYDLSTESGQAKYLNDIH